MANPEHLEWLRKGVAAWNVRKARDNFVADLIGSRLRNVQLNGVDLEYAVLNTADLSNASLATANFNNAKLHKCKLEGILAKDSSFKSANLREADLRQADLREAKLNGADMIFARMSGGDFRSAVMKDARLCEVDLRNASLEGTNFENANLTGMDIRTTFKLDMTNQKPHSITPTDLSAVGFITQEQINSVLGDSQTILPIGISRPKHWPVFLIPAEPRTDNASSSPERARVNTPRLPESPQGSGVGLSKSNKLALGHNDIPPKNRALIGLYTDLREMMSDVRSLGDLDNVAPILGRSLARFIDRAPISFDDLEQHRFGASTAALHMQFDAERPKLENKADIHVGHIAALLHHADLITARLPDWQSFLAEEEDTKEAFLAREEDSTAILETAAEALRTSPETFDISLFERIREYLDDKTIEGYLASKELLLSIAHKVFTLAGELVKDTASETRKLAIKGLAAGLLASLGAPLLKLAGVLPKQLDWLTKWLEYLPSLLT